MKLTLTNLGAIDHAEIELGDFTIICGENNTGKTYATYAMYGFLSFWNDAFHIRLPNQIGHELIDVGTTSLNMTPFIENPSAVLHKACQEYVEHLPQVFASPQKRFTHTQVSVQVEPVAHFHEVEFERSFSIGGSTLVISKAKGAADIIASMVAEKGTRKVPGAVITRLVGQVARDELFGGVIPRPFIVSAERTGAAIFKNELNLQRNRMIEELGRTDGDCDPFELINRVYSDYPMPVKSSINFARKREEIAKQESFIAKGHRAVLIEYEDILGGQFDVGRDEQMRFTPKGSKAHLSMDESSSSVRSLLDLGLYLSSVAKKGDLLIIDEPELNLHPQNQRRVARLLSRLVRLGLKVLITTHSDYIIKELNLLMMLNSTEDRVVAIAEREKYDRQSFLDPDKVRAYVASTELMIKPGKKRRSQCKTLVAMPVNCETGITIGSFDKAIEDLNRIEDELVYGDVNGE